MDKTTTVVENAWSCETTAISADTIWELNKDQSETLRWNTNPSCMLIKELISKIEENSWYIRIFWYQIYSSGEIFCTQQNWPTLHVCCIPVGSQTSSRKWLMIFKDFSIFAKLKFAYNRVTGRVIRVVINIFCHLFQFSNCQIFSLEFIFWFLSPG